MLGIWSPVVLIALSCVHDGRHLANTLKRKSSPPRAASGVEDEQVYVLLSDETFCTGEVCPGSSEWLSEPGNKLCKPKKLF